MLKSLKLISDPTRLRIVTLLQNESLSVAELQEILGMGQSRISMQLSQLKSAGIVADERSGKNNIYRCSGDPEILRIANAAARELDEIEADQRALHHIRRKRKDTARAYFDELAGRFGKDYVPGRSWKALAEALLKIHRYRTVADLGAGEGTLSQLLAQRAESVIAVDISPRMVEYGQSVARENGLLNVEYRLGDIEDPPIDANEVELAVLSQALHHAEEPPRAIRSAYRILKPGGRLIVLDLIQHQFEQARELHADRWLGFSENSVAEMLEASGFTQVETLVADKEENSPGFQTLLAIGEKL